MTSASAHAKEQLDDVGVARSITASAARTLLRARGRFASDAGALKATGGRTAQEHIAERLARALPPDAVFKKEASYIAKDRHVQDALPGATRDPPPPKQRLDYRGYAGQVANGVMKIGDKVLVLPSGLSSKMSASTPPTAHRRSRPPMCVTIRLADELDISRGDVICPTGNHPDISQDIDLMTCWMDDLPLTVGHNLSIFHATRSARAVVKETTYDLDVNTLHRSEVAHELGMNGIGRVKLRTTTPLVADEYVRNRTAGAFMLTNESTNRTVGAGAPWRRREMTSYPYSTERRRARSADKCMIV